MNSPVVGRFPGPCIQTRSEVREVGGIFTVSRVQEGNVHFFNICQGMEWNGCHCDILRFLIPLLCPHAAKQICMLYVYKKTNHIFMWYIISPAINIPNSMM